MRRGSLRFVAFDSARLEAFTDGVIAVIITITVLDIRAPHGTTLRDLGSVFPVYVAYALSFVYVGIYWNNHHHTMRAAKAIDARVMWANLHVLFWLSLVPFATTWVGEHHREAIPTALYGTILFMVAAAFIVMQRCMVAANGRDSAIGLATRADRKGNGSLVLYAAAIALAFFAPWISDVLFFAVAALWFVPDRRMERVIAGDGERSP